MTKIVWGMWSVFFLGFLFTILFFKSVENNWFDWWGELPNVQLFEKPIIQKQSIVYTADGNVIGNYYQSNRQIIPYHEIPPYVINALISIEDPNFFKHSGIDFSAHSPLFIRGTITSFLQYQLYCRPNLKEKGTLYNNRFFRQIGYILKRFFTLLKIERTYTKEEIITMYLNYENFGHNSHGIESASKTYFNKSASELNIQEASLLMGILKAPTTDIPRLHPNRANKRRNRVFFSLFRESFITKVVYDSLCKLPIELDFNLPNSNHNIAPHFRHVVKKEALKILKRHEKKTREKYSLYSDGLKIFTTLDSQLQKHAKSAVKENQANTGFLSITPQTGFVKAWVSDSVFKNHVLIKHEVGSLFKPIIYSTLLNYSNCTLKTELEEKPISLKLENEKEWILRGKSTRDKITLKRYFTHTYPFLSLNDQLVEKVGIPNIVKHAQELGLEIPKDEQSSHLVSGITYQNLYDMVKAYSVFVNEGKLITPVFITQIQDQNGKIIYEHIPQVRQVIPKEKALDMIELLKERQNLAFLKRNYEIEKIGGMTGISQQNRDHWFIGFTPELISGCWVEGNLKKSKNMAMPIFGEYMQTIYADSTITTVK